MPEAHSYCEIKLRTEIHGKIQRVLWFPAPLSQGPREVPSYFLDNDWERVKKGKTWNLWQSLSLPAKAKLSLKQCNAGSRGPHVPITPKYMGTSTLLQSLTTADAPHQLSGCTPTNSPAVTNCTIFHSPSSWTAFSGNKGTTLGQKNAWMTNSMVRRAAPCRKSLGVCI